MASKSSAREIFARAMMLSEQADWVGLGELLKEHPELAKALDETGNTLLDNIAFEASVETLDRLVADGADVNHLDSEGIGVLHSLAGQRKPDIDRLRWFLSKGADVSNLSRLGWRPLHFVAERGVPEAASVLIAAGADINARTEHDSCARTPLMIAAHTNNLDVMCLLLERGADLTLRDKLNRTVRDYAGLISGWRVRRLLNERGRNI